MARPRVLVGTPIYEAKEYCRERFVKNLQRLNYPRGDWHWTLVDNSRKPAYSHKLKRLYPGHVARVPRGSNSRDALRNAMNYLRHKALREGYDYLMFIESDLFPPPDAIQRLLRHGRPVTGLPYEVGFGARRSLCVFILDQKNIGLGTRRLTKEESVEFMNGSLRAVHGMGVGCTLIKRDILERYPFWYSAADDDRMKGLPIRKHPDTYFYLQLHNDGVKVYCDTSVLVPHENSDWAKVKDQ